MSPRFLFFAALFVGGLGYALVKVGSCERWVAGLQVTAFIATMLAFWSGSDRAFSTLQAPLFWIDVVLLFGLGFIALRAKRFWPLWITALQSATVLAHFGKAIEADMPAIGYALQAQLWAYPMIMLTAVGAWRHQQRLARYGNDPSWKTYSGQSNRLEPKRSPKLS